MEALLGASARRRVLQVLVQGLTVLTFVLMCWVGYRALRFRTDCVNSSFISYVYFPGRAHPVENCLFESRLSLESWFHPLSPSQQQNLRQLETAEPLSALFPTASPTIAVLIQPAAPRATATPTVEIDAGQLRLSELWLTQDDETSIHARRALAMTILKTHLPHMFNTQFDLEVFVDFLAFVYHAYPDAWSRAGQTHSMVREVKFATSSISFATYCESPFASILHRSSCVQTEFDRQPASDDLQGRLWGLRPLLSVGLYRMFEALPLAKKMAVLERLRRDQPLPVTPRKRSEKVEDTLGWVDEVLGAYAEYLGVREPHLERVSQVNLQLEAPVRWELTVDITKTPAWKKIVQQLQVRSHYRQNERVLVFTPEGAMALPSGLPVAWAPSDIHSQKHVLIACQWPNPHEAINVKARHVFARQSCQELAQPFWD